MTDYSADRKYTKEHEWIAISGETATVGVTSYAVEQLGDVVHLELPEPGAQFKAGASFGTVESTKTVSDLYMPADAEVVEVNKVLLASPEELASDPHNKGWLIKVKVTGALSSSLLEAADYQRYIEEDTGH